MPAPVTRRLRLSSKRCLVYVSGSGYRRYKPNVVALGASQRIYDLSWTRWGRRAARGSGTFPANDCVPDCATGTITPYPVRVRLSRVRVCDGYLQYLRLRWTYRAGRPPGARRSEIVSFDYNC